MSDQDHETRITVVEKSITNIEVDVAAILKLLQGNGGEGMVTSVALNKDRFKRVWWWLGGVSMGVLGIAFFVIRSGLTK